MTGRNIIIPPGMENLYERFHYAPAVRVDNTLYIAGQVGRDENLQVVEGAEAQYIQAFENLKKVLEAAAETVTPGGTLVYATCSLEPEENEGQVELFLKRRADFERDPPPPGSVPAELLAPNGDLRVLPQEHGIDGAYAARLRRRAD